MWNRRSLQPRRGPWWSTLSPCSPWALCGADLHMQPWRSPWCSSGCVLEEAAVHGTQQEQLWAGAATHGDQFAVHQEDWGSCHPWGPMLVQCLESCSLWKATQGQFRKDGIHGRDQRGAGAESDHTTTVLFVTKHRTQGFRAHEGSLYSLDSLQGVIPTFSRENSSRLSQAPLLRIFQIRSLERKQNID